MVLSNLSRKSWEFQLEYSAAIFGFGSFRCSDERPPKPSSGERREALNKKTKNVRTVDGKAAFYQNLEPPRFASFWGDFGSDL